MPRALIESTFGNELPFNDWSGMDYVEATAKRARVAMPFAAHLADADNRIAEGALLALADTTGGLAAVAAFGGVQQVATSTLQMSFLAAVPPGTGVIAEGTILAHDAMTTLVDVQLSTDDAARLPVRQSRVRLISTHPSAASQETTEHSPAPLARTAPPAQPLAFPEAIGFRQDTENRARVPFQPCLIGNASRRMIHGGVVASGMAEALARLRERDGRPAMILDSTTDFMRPALAHDMIITTHIRRAGRRYIFADADVQQDLPGTGLVTVAAMRATLF